MSIQNGKKPLSSKPRQQSPASLEDIFGNTLGIEASISDALMKKGLEYRWISMKKYGDMGNSHERAWRPVKRSECGIIDPTAITNGSDPDGYIRRGDLVLAVRSKDLGDKHRAFLKSQADRQRNVQREHANELKEFVKKSGINATISEGYGEEENE